MGDLTKGPNLENYSYCQHPSFPWASATTSWNGSSVPEVPRVEPKTPPVRDCDTYLGPLDPKPLNP